MFRDREDAGCRLAQALARFKQERPVVLALPRGGVPVGLEIAKALDAPLDLVLVRKVGAPGHPELAVAAVVDGDDPQTVVNQDVAGSLRVTDAYIAAEGARQLAEIERRRQLYFRGRPPVEVRDRTAIVVDDGMATGATARVALQALRRKGAGRLVLAMPVAPADTLASMESDFDEAVCLSTPTYFGALSLFYDDFRQLDDDDVIDLLRRAPGDRDAGGP